MGGLLGFQLALICFFHRLHILYLSTFSFLTVWEKDSLSVFRVEYLLLILFFLYCRDLPFLLVIELVHILKLFKPVHLLLVRRDPF